MTTIVVTHEDNEVDQFTFDASDRVITIGRRSTNDVCIPNLSVSGMHARLTIDADGALIEDNSSTNGTYVNGRLISRQLLNNDDEVVIGKSRITVQVSAQPVAASPDVDDDRHAAADNLNHHSDSPISPPVLNNASDHEFDDDAVDNSVVSQKAQDMFDDDDSFVGEALPDDALPVDDHDQYDDRPMSLSEKAKLALGRENGRDAAPQRSGFNGAAVGAVAATSATAAASRAFASDGDTAVAEAPEVRTAQGQRAAEIGEAHPLDGLDDQILDGQSSKGLSSKGQSNDHVAPQPIDHSADASSDAQIAKPAGAVIEIQNGAKSGQVLPIDKPVTTLGRPGIQIAAIMRKPDGYFLMHIESDDSVDMPTLNRDTIGDDPVMLQSGDRLNVAGIDVEFMLS